MNHATDASLTHTWVPAEGDLAVVGPIVALEKSLADASRK